MKLNWYLFDLYRERMRKWETPGTSKQTSISVSAVGCGTYQYVSNKDRINNSQAPYLVGAGLIVYSF